MGFTITQTGPGWKTRVVKSATLGRMIQLKSIQDAAIRLRGQVLKTPCVASKTLSDITGAQVFLKFENLQFTASFKERGACNKLAQIANPQAGVIALAVEATTADSVTLRLPQNDQLARPGGMLCGQAMMSAAAPSPTRCAKWVSSGRFW